MRTPERAGRARRWCVVVVGTVLALTALAGCTGAPQDVGATSVGRWSQSDSGRPDYTLLQEAAGPGGGLITSAEELEVLADAIDAAVEAGDDPDADATTAELRATDMDDVVLVTVGYHRCTEYSAVEADTGADPVELIVDVRSDEPETLCAWAPYTLDVWALDRDAVGDDPVLVEAD